MPITNRWRFPSFGSTTELLAAPLTGSLTRLTRVHLHIVATNLSLISAFRDPYISLVPGYKVQFWRLAFFVGASANARSVLLCPFSTYRPPTIRHRHTHDGSPPALDEDMAKYAYAPLSVVSSRRCLTPALGVSTGMNTNSSACVGRSLPEMTIWLKGCSTAKATPMREGRSGKI